jgi:hypothetical protein
MVAVLSRFGKDLDIGYGAEQLAIELRRHFKTWRMESACLTSLCTHDLFLRSSTASIQSQQWRQ